MKNKQRAAVLLLILTLLASFLPGAYAATYEDAENFQKEIDAVTGLGIMDGENSKQFFPEDYLDRAEMIRILMNLRNSQTGDRRQRFQDVRTDYYAFDAIDEAIHLGYIEVGEDRLFRPEEKATSEEAVKILLYMLNYKTYVDQGVTSIYSLAETAGLLKGVRFSGNNITKAQLAKLIYNSFSSKMLEMSGISGINVVITESPDKTTLYYLGLKMIEGDLLANSDSSLYYSGSPAMPGCVRIDDETYYEGNSGVSALLGYSVEAFVTDEKDGSETVIYAVKGEKNDFVVIEAEEIIEVEDSKITYGQKRGKTLKLYEDMCIVYNGVAVKYDEALFDIGYGTITFIKSESAEGKGYNVAIIDEYESFAVSSVSTADERIYLKNGTFNERMYIDVAEENESSVYIYEDGILTNLEAVTADSIISVFYGQGSHEVIKIIVSKKSFSAVMKATGSGSDRDEPTSVFDSGEYIHAPNIVGAEKLNLGESFVLSLDYKGYLVEVRTSDAVKNYAAFLKATYDDAEDTCYVKVLTKEGKLVTYQTVNEKIRMITGHEKVSVAPKNVADLLSGNENTVILLEINAENKIKSITFSVPYNTTDLPANDSIFTLYQTTTSALASYGAIAGVGTGNAITFIIPNAGADGIVDYSKAKVQAGGYFGAGSSYSNIQFYDVDISAQAKAVLVRATAGAEFSTSTYEGGVFLVDRISETIDADDEPIRQLEGFQNGQELKLPISAKELNNLTNSAAPEQIYNLTRGDVILFATNSDGEVSAYAVLYADATHRNRFAQTYNGGNGYGTTRTCSVYHATVQFVSNEALTLRTPDDVASPTVPAGGKPSAIVYKIDRSRGRITKGEWGDIIGMNPYTQMPGSEVVARTSRNGAQEVFIYED
ncbi:MAG: hypothetical protein E7397_02270 [Ruminococcaceae bacterium]|nr:hypothetical protein [Oscillospiraceae bacterium]